MRVPPRSLIFVGILFVCSACLALAGSLVSGGLHLFFVAIVLSMVLLAVLVVGVMVPQLGLFASSLSRGASGRAEIALTFDDGPDEATTPRILSILASAGARATFFVLGGKVQGAPEIVRAIESAGHEIGVHGQTHDRFLSLRTPKAIVESVSLTQSAVEAVTGRRPTLFRPPLGHVSPRTAEAAKATGLTLVAWSVRSRDGLASTTPEQVVRRVLGTLRLGDIVLMHDAAEKGDREPASIAALPEILEELRRRGLKCVTVSQLMKK